MGEGTRKLHVACIMDGNGRWAQRKRLARTEGHTEGEENLARLVRLARVRNVGWLTVFGFSTENWSRPPQEISDLMGLLKTYVNSDLERLAREGVRVRILGRRTGLSDDILEVIEGAGRRTRPGRAGSCAG